MSKNTGKPSDRLPKKNAITRSVLLANDTEVGEQYRLLQGKVGMLEIRLRASDDNPIIAKMLEEAQQELDDYEPTMRENSIKFLFKAIGRRNMEKLVNDHQPTEAQLAEVEEAKAKAIAEGDKDITEDMSVQWNFETFPAALIARSMVAPLAWSPETEDEILEWLDGEEWTTAEIGELFTAALSANNSSDVLKMGKGSRKTRS
jgi:hypothetical protein